MNQMTLSKVNKFLLTILYGLGLVMFSTIIFGDARFPVISEIITYLFYLFSVLSILKGMMDLITQKTLSDLLYLFLAAMPMLVLLVYLVLSETYGG